MQIVPQVRQNLNDLLDCGLDLELASHALPLQVALLSQLVQLANQQEDPEQPENTSNLEEATERRSVFRLEIQEHESNRKQDDDQVKNIPHVSEVQAVIPDEMQGNFYNEDAQDDQFTVVEMPFKVGVILEHRVFE